MPKPLDCQRGLQNLSINSRKLQALLSHPLRRPYRPHLIPTPSQTPVRLIQNLAAGTIPSKKAQIEIQGDQSHPPHHPSHRLEPQRMGDWKREMERVFEGDPRTYGKGRQKILKALDFVDQSLVTLWYTYRDRKEKRKSHKMKRWSKFLAWTKKKIQGGQNSTANMYSNYDAARHRPDEPPYHFDS